MVNVFGGVLVIETLTDVSYHVDAVFDELECIIDTQIVDHSGDSAALLVWHGCFEGMICKSHYDAILSITIPKINGFINSGRSAKCGYCNQDFYCPDDFLKVYPL